MKSFKILAATLIVAALAACGGQAHAAAPIAKQTYVSTDNKVFSLQDVRKITSDPAGYIVLTFINGETSYNYLADVGGVTFNAIKVSQPSLILLSSDSRVLLNLSYARYTTCNVSSGTIMIGWSAGGSEWLSDPGCVSYAAAK